MNFKGTSSSQRKETFRFILRNFRIFVGIQGETTNKRGILISVYRERGSTNEKTPTFFSRYNSATLT